MTAKPSDAYLLKVGSIDVVDADEGYEVIGGWVEVCNVSIDFVIGVSFEEL